MALTDFFRINLPYGMRKNDVGEWFFFNREYIPLGWNDRGASALAGKKHSFEDLPVYTKYKGLSESTLLKLAWDHQDGLRKNDKGEITSVWFYNDRTNPTNDPDRWDDYFERLKLLSKCQIKN